MDRQQITSHQHTCRNHIKIRCILPWDPPHCRRLSWQSAAPKWQARGPQGRRSATGRWLSWEVQAQRYHCKADSGVTGKSQGRGTSHRIGDGAAGRRATVLGRGAPHGLLKRWQKALRSLQPKARQPATVDIVDPGEVRRADYVPLDRSFTADSKSDAVDPFETKSPNTVDLGTIWGLIVLGTAYVHHSTTGFALPALLPVISPDLHLTDSQGALLTTGYTVLYAIALVPVGFLADRVNRPRLLAGGLTLWSLLTMAASKVNSFGELLALRVGFAAAQAMQNPLCYALIPELFPRERSTAMAAYNAAIYVGRAFSFAAVILAGKMGATQTADDPVGVTLVPLDLVDLSHVSILYTQGDLAAITPIYDYDFRVLYGSAAIQSWRELLFWLGPPGLLVAGLALLTLREPRQRAPSLLGGALAPARGSPGLPATAMNRKGPRGGRAAAAAAAAARAARGAAARKADGDIVRSVRALLASRPFQAVTAAAAINDVGSWALVSWQATFYARVYGVGPETYAPALALILPAGGILGGVGGGLAGDWLARRGGRAWLTAGATLAAAPLLIGNVLAGDFQQSLAFLLVGFALSEMWRAPAAIMVRDIAPPALGSTGSALHLCFRNLIGASGPLCVAYLEPQVGLQKAMLVVPGCYLLSGLAFFFAERIVAGYKSAPKGK